MRALVETWIKPRKTFLTPADKRPNSHEIIRRYGLDGRVGAGSQDAIPINQKPSLKLVAPIGSAAVLQVP